MAKGDKRPVVMQSDRAVNGGIATLDASGNVPFEQLGNVVGKQLLDNAYFANPVDQRSGHVVPPGTEYYRARDWTDTYLAGTVTEYTPVVQDVYTDVGIISVGEKKYYVKWFRAVRFYSNSTWGTAHCIDRWYLNAASWNVAERKLTAIENFGRIIQRVEGTDSVGKKVTFSALVHSVTGGRLYVFCGPGDYGMVSVPEGFNGVVSTTVVVPNPGGSALSFSIALDTAGASAVIEAAKLELGSTQTLAHQDADGTWVLNEIPDYGEELLKCQRYYQLFTSEDKRPTDNRDFRPELRTNATSSNTGTIDIGGVTYWYANAEL